MAKTASPVFIPGISYLCEDQRPWGTSNESDIVGVTTDMSKGRFNTGQQHLIPAAVGLASQLPGSWHTGHRCWSSLPTSAGSAAAKEE